MDQPAADARPRTRPPEASLRETDQPSRTSSNDTDRQQPDSIRPEQERASSLVRNETPATRASVSSGSGDHSRATRPRDAEVTATDRTGLPPRPVSPLSADRQRLAERLERMENPPSSRDALQSRLTHLEPGHPSSPWNEDGSPRPPAPRLSDLELPEPPLSDAEYAEHRREVASGLERAYTETKAMREAWFVSPDRDIWSDERIALQDGILEEIYSSANDVPCEWKAIIAGGLGGSGKTTVLEQHPGITPSEFLTINPDSIKEKMALRKMVPEIPGLSPMEATSLSHEESSYIARRLANRAYAEGKNVIWDITMSKPGSATGRVSELRTAGYQHVDGVFVDIPIEMSVTRAEARHRRGHDKYLVDEGLGGRYVPPEIILSQSDNQFSSANRREFEKAKPLLDSWVVYDNSVDGTPAVIVERSQADSREDESRRP